ncbi:MAG: hypothetical protein ACOCR8_01030, partial [Desulfosalsimonas sp.]
MFSISNIYNLNASGQLSHCKTQEFQYVVEKLFTVPSKYGIYQKISMISIVSIYFEARGGLLFSGIVESPWFMKMSGKTQRRSFVFWMLTRPGAGFSVAAFGPGICTARYAA